MAAIAAVPASPPGPTSASRAQLLWQHPFVDVFKRCSVDDAERRGDVAEELDRQIGKRVFRIRGAISANNFIQLPGPRSAVRSLDLTGQYVYLQLRSLGVKFFLVHLDFIVGAANSFRISLSNIYSQVKATYHTVQCPCHLSSQWTVVCVHVPSVLKRCRGGLRTDAFVMKSLQLCASLVVRGVYTSDIRYSADGMPRDMALDNRPFAEHFFWLDVPSPHEAEDEAPTSAGTSPGGGGPAAAAGAAARTAVPRREAASPAPASSPLPEPARAVPRENAAPPTAVSSLPDPMLQVSRIIGMSKKAWRVAELPEALPRRHAVFIRCAAEATAAAADAKVAQRAAPLGAVYASSMTLALVNVRTRAKRFFFGHSQPIQLLEASRDGLLVASAQCHEGGGAPVLRLWLVGTSPASLRCASVLPCPTLALAKAMALDQEGRSLALAGVDPQGRQQLLVWDIQHVAAGGSASLIARQTSADWDLDCVRFSPYEALSLVTCGRENIRFWRVKAGHLPGRNVALNSLARQTHFTCVAFESNKVSASERPLQAEVSRVLVGTSQGRVLHLSCKDLKVLASFDLHDAAITAIACANKGFVVTASVDRYVRVWPSDFQSFYLHAMHAAPVIGVDISSDGLNVLCSTADGSVGMLDIQDPHNYVDISRSHAASITDAATSVFFQELVTASRDGKLKVWSLASMAQTYEFDVVDDVPNVVAFHPRDRHLIAGGFESGCLRIFDVDGPALLFEHWHHRQAIESLVFVADLGTHLQDANVVTCDAGGALAFHAETHGFEVVRCPDKGLLSFTRPPAGCSAIACRLPWFLQYLDSQSVALLTYPELQLVRKLQVTGSHISAMELSFGSRFAVVGTADSKLHLFRLSTGKLSLTRSLTGGPIRALAMADAFDSGSGSRCPSLVLAATGDTLLRLVELPMVQGGAVAEATGEHLASKGKEQCFMGHATCPHRVIITPTCVVSISTSEVICWAASGKHLEELFKCDFSEPAGRAADADGQQAVLPGSKSRSAGSQDRSRSAPPTVSRRSPCIGQEERRERAESPGSPLPTRRAGRQPSAEVEDHRPWTDSPVRTSYGAREDKGYVEPGKYLLEGRPSPLIRRSYASPEPSTRSGSRVAGSPESFTRSAIRTDTWDSGTSTKVGARLKAIAGCTLRGAQSFAWSRRARVLCHAIGSAIRVEPLGAPAASAADVGLDRVGCIPAQPQLLDTLHGQVVALSLDPHGNSLLGVLSSGSSGVSMSLWCLQSFRQRNAQALPPAYAVASAQVGVAGPGHHCNLSGPLLQLLPGAHGAVTAAACFSSTSTGGCGRVDVWECCHVSSGWSLSCSAELHASAPTQLLLLSDSSEEFLTLSAKKLLFWRCTEHADAGNAGPGPSAGRWSLQYQDADEAGGWAGSDAMFTCFCAARCQDLQLVLCGRTDGCASIYNSDENALLAEPELAGGRALVAIACGTWPVLICAVSSEVMVCTLARGYGGAFHVAGTSSSVLMDGCVLGIQVDPSLPEDAVVSSAHNTLWYVSPRQRTRVPLQAFHISHARALAVQDNERGSGGGNALRGRSAPKLLATGTDSGQVWLWQLQWEVRRGLHMHPVAKLDCGGGACTAVLFLSSERLACSFLSGTVQVFSLVDFSLVDEVEPFDGEPVLAMAALGEESACILGSSSGALAEVRSGPTCSVSKLEGRSSRSPICGMSVEGGDAHTRSSSCGRAQACRALVCHANCQLSVWECGPRAAARHVHAWSWPGGDSVPIKAWDAAAQEDEGSLLELLSSPPLVASFLPSCVGDGLVAVSAPPAPQLYIYSFKQGRVVNCVQLSACFPAALRIRPLRPMLRPQAVAAAAQVAQAESDGAVLLLLYHDRFAQLCVCAGGTHACWVEEPKRLAGAPPAAPTSVGPPGGVPDACVLAERDGHALEVLLWSDTSLSCWEMQH